MWRVRRRAKAPNSKHSPASASGLIALDCLRILASSRETRPLTICRQRIRHVHISAPLPSLLFFFFAWLTTRGTCAASWLCGVALGGKRLIHVAHGTCPRTQRLARTACHLHFCQAKCTCCVRATEASSSVIWPVAESFVEERLMRVRMSMLALAPPPQDDLTMRDVGIWSWAV